MKLDLHNLALLLQSYIARGYSFQTVCRKIRNEYEDITLFTDNQEEIQKQYEAKLSFREEMQCRYNKVAA